MSRFDGIELPFWEVQREALRRLGARFGAFQAVYWLVFGPCVLAYSAGVFDPLEQADPLLGQLAPNLLIGLLMPLADGAVILLLAGDGKRSLGESLRGGLSLWLTLLFISLLAGLAVMVGVVCFVVPAVLLATWFSLAWVVAVDRGYKDPFRCLFASRALVRGHLFEVLFAFLPIVAVPNIAKLVLWAVQETAAGDAPVWADVANIAVDQLFLAVNVVAVVVYERLAPGAPVGPPPPAGPAPEETAP